MLSADHHPPAIPPQKKPQRNMLVTKKLLLKIVRTMAVVQDDTYKRTCPVNIKCLQAHLTHELTVQ